jgi:hypothetical protein
MAYPTYKKRNLRGKGKKTKKQRSYGKNRTFNEKVAYHQTKRRGGVNSDHENSNNENNSNHNSGYSNYSNIFSQDLFEGPVSPLSQNDKRWLRIANVFFQTRPQDVPEELFENVMNDNEMDYTLRRYKKWRLETFAIENNIRYTHIGRKHIYNLLKVFDYIQRKYKQMHRRMNDKLWQANAKLHKQLEAEWVMLVNERRDRIIQNNDTNDVIRNRRPFPPYRRQYDTYITRYYKPIENAIYQDNVYSNNSNSSSNNND